MIVDHIDSMGYDSLDVLNRLVDHCLQGVGRLCPIPIRKRYLPLDFLRTVVTSRPMPMRHPRLQNPRSDRRCLIPRNDR